jgi:hypothetical protein
MAHSVSGKAANLQIGISFTIGAIDGWITQQRGQLFLMSLTQDRKSKMRLLENGHMAKKAHQFGIWMSQYIACWRFARSGQEFALEAPQNTQPFSQNLGALR